MLRLGLVHTDYTYSAERNQCMEPILASPSERKQGQIQAIQPSPDTWIFSEGPQRQIRYDGISFGASIASLSVRKAQRCSSTRRSLDIVNTRANELTYQGQLMLPENMEISKRIIRKQ